MVDMYEYNLLNILYYIILYFKLLCAKCHKIFEFNLIFINIKKYDIDN